MKWHLRRHVKSKSWGFNQPPRTTVAIVRSGHFGKFWLILWPSACFVLAPEGWQACPLRQVWGEKFGRFLTMQIYHDLLWQRIILSTCNLQNLFCVYVCTRDQETGHSNISAEKNMSNNIHYANLSTMDPIFPIHLSLKWRLLWEKISPVLWQFPWMEVYHLQDSRLMLKVSHLLMSGTSQHKYQSLQSLYSFLKTN